MYEEIKFLFHYIKEENKKEYLDSKGKEVLKKYPFLGITNSLIVKSIDPIDEKNFSFYNDLLLENFDFIDHFKIRYASFFYDKKEYSKSTEILSGLKNPFLRWYFFIF